MCNCTFRVLLKSSYFLTDAVLLSIKVHKMLGQEAGKLIEFDFLKFVSFVTCWVR